MDLKQKLAALPHLRVNDLRSMYAEVFGEPTRANNSDWLAKRLAWRLQAQAMGGLSERAQQRAKELASEDDLRALAASDAPNAGHDAERTRPTPARARGGHHPPVQGPTHHVEVLADGFIWNGTDLSHAHRGRQGHHGPASEWLRLLRDHQGEGPMKQARSQDQDSLCHLHPQEHRGRPGAGVQQPRCPAGVGRSLHQEPGPRRLGLPSRQIRRWRLHRRQHGPPGPQAAA